MNFASRRARPTRSFTFVLSIFFALIALLAAPLSADPNGTTSAMEATEHATPEDAESDGTFPATGVTEVALAQPSSLPPLTPFRHEGSGLTFPPAPVGMTQRHVTVYDEDGYNASSNYYTTDNESNVTVYIYSNQDTSDVDVPALDHPNPYLQRAQYEVYEVVYVQHYVTGRLDQASYNQMAPVPMVDAIKDSAAAGWSGPVSPDAGSPELWQEAHVGITKGWWHVKVRLTCPLEKREAVRRLMREITTNLGGEPEDETSVEVRAIINDVILDAVNKAAAERDAARASATHAGDNDAEAPADTEPTGGGSE